MKVGVWSEINIVSISVSNRHISAGGNEYVWVSYAVKSPPFKKGSQRKPLAKQRGEVWRPKANNRIPAFRRIESQSATSRVRSVGHIIETLCESSRIDLQKNVSDNLNMEKSDAWLTAGLMNPIGDLPSAIRASFTIVKIAPTTGEDADVP